MPKKNYSPYALISSTRTATVPSAWTICKRAKVNKGSFYYFFKTKTDLVVAAYEEHRRLKEPDYERIFAAQNPR